MSSTSPLESNEDLEIKVLVRMEDIQPQKNTLYVEIQEEECFVDNIYCDNECVINDENSNLESVVFINSEEMISGVQNDSDSGEYIVPEMIEFTENIHEVNRQCQLPKSNRWPTLEILPGGVIKDADKYKASNETITNNNVKEEMYACAKCTKTFEHLFKLVKHLKWHEDEDKKTSGIVFSPDKKEEQCEEESDGITEDIEGASDMIYACAICPRKYTKLLSLVKHVKWHKDIDKKKDNSAAKTCPYHKVLSRRKTVLSPQYSNKTKKS